jgi:GTPase SAR1 family protein
VNVQLWDVSGDERYLTTWSAIAWGADGAILVYNGWDRDSAKRLEKYQRFALELKPDQCLCVAHQIGAIEGKPVRPKIPKNVEGAQITLGNAAMPKDDFAVTINRWLSKVYQEKQLKLEEKERELLGEEQAAKAAAAEAAGAGGRGPYSDFDAPVPAGA